MVSIAVALAAAARADARADAHAALALASPDADLIVFAPDLKRTSDELTQLLERMERAELLVGSRPIDLLKSLVGIGAGFDDHGPVVALLYETGDALAPRPFDALVLLPTTDAQQFLESSLDPAGGAEADAYRTHDGRAVYARPMGSHIVLGESGARVRSYEPGAGLAAAAVQSLGERGSAIMNAADIVVLDRSGAIARVLHDRGAAIHGKAEIDQVHARRLHELADRIETWGEGMKAGIIAIDVDPLALIIRSFAAFDPGHEAGRMTTGGPRSIEPLSALPGKPFYLAASIDKSGLGGEAIMRMLGQSLGVGEIPDWLVAASGLQFAVYPSPAGLQGGILNDAALVMRTSQPVQARDFLKQQILALRDRDDGVARQITWEDAKAIKSGLVADAYEVLVTDQPAEFAQLQAMQQLIFGSRGWRGFVHATEHELVMTFSQRPAVLEAAIAAAVQQDKVFADQSVVRAMQGYLPPESDAQLFLGIGEILGLIRQLAESFGGLVPIDLPQIDGPVEPLALGAAVQDHTIETSLIAPASVLRIVFDQAVSQAAAPEAATERAGEGAAP
jgi:hypothetical protein